MYHRLMLTIRAAALLSALLPLAASIPEPRPWVT
jgi:hypothetical protein